MLPWKSDWQQLECRLMDGGGGVGRGLGGGSQTIRLTVSKCNRFAPRRVWEGSGQWIIGSAPDSMVVPAANKDFVAFMIFFDT